MRRAMAAGSAAQKVGRLEDRAHDALGRDGIIVNVVAVADERAAEVLRPRPIDGSIENDMAEASGAQFLRLRREPEKGVDLALGEQVERPDLRIGAGDPTYVFCGIETDLKRHEAQQTGRAPLQADAFAFQTGDAADVVPREQLETADMHTGEDGLAAQ